MFIFSLILWYSYETLPTKHIKKFQKLNLRSWNIYYIFFLLWFCFMIASQPHTSTFSLRLKSLFETWLSCSLLLSAIYLQTTDTSKRGEISLLLQSSSCKAKSWPTACLISVGSLGVWVWKKTTPQHKHKLQRECLVLLGKKTVKRTTWDQNNILDGS